MLSIYLGSSLQRPVNRPCQASKTVLLQARVRGFSMNKGRFTPFWKNAAFRIDICWGAFGGLISIDKDSCGCDFKLIKDVVKGGCAFDIIADN